MTVIAYRDGILAADTLITAGYDRVGHVQKIHKYSKTWLVGTAGTSGAHIAILAWLSNNIEGEGDDERIDLYSPITFPTGMDSSALLVHKPTGKVFYADTSSPYLMEITTPFVTIGSGSTTARTAMYLGQSAKEAVETAMHLDIGCGGHLTWLSTSGDDDSDLKESAL